MRRPPPRSEDRLATLLARHDEDPEEAFEEEWLPDSGAGSIEGAGRARRPGLLSVPSSLDGATVRPAWWAVIGVVAALVVVVAAVGGWALWTHTDARPSVSATPAPAPSDAVVPTRTALPAGFGGTAAAPTPTGGATGATAPATAAEWSYVHVVGAVGRPGVVRVRSGSRIVDAVTQAGGPLPKADLAGLNLARPVVDGEQIVVTLRGQPRPSAPPASPSAPTGAVSGAPAPAGTTGATGAVGGPVDLNQADLATLDTLPGVGPVLAQRILDWRAAHGRFTSVDQLGDVEGVGDKTLERLTPLVRV